MIRRITFILPSFAGGGAERVMIMLANGLDRTRFMPSIIVLQAHGPLREIVDDDIPIINLNRQRLRHGLKPLITVIREAKPYAVIPTMGYVNLCILAIWKMIGRDIKVIIREANEVDATINAIKCPLLGRILYSCLYPRASQVITPTRIISDDLNKRWKVSEKKLVVLPNPVDVKMLRKQAILVNRHPGEGKRFVASGRLVKQKGFDQLINWLKEMPLDTHVTIFGEGDMKNSLVAQARKLGVVKQVRFAGFSGNPWGYYAGADAFLLPSRWEGMSNAALEALAVGTPVIGTPQSGGLSEIAKETKSNAVIIANSGAEFVNALLKAHSENRSTLRPSLLPDSFSLDQVNQKFEQILAS